VAAPDRFVTDSPRHLLRAMLRAWPLHEQRAFFERTLGIPLTIEVESGKLFPASNRAKDVRDALVEHARRKGVDLQFDTTLLGVSRHASGFTVETSRGMLECDRVTLATGGLSVPATGSDGAGLRLAQSLGLAVVEPYPALTPLTDDSHRHASLSGVSLPVRLRARSETSQIETTGGFLFTHRGYSGPSVLDISHVTARVSTTTPVIRAQWSTLNARDWERELSTTVASDSVATILSRQVPSRLAEQLMRECGIPLDRRTSSLKRTERNALIEALTSYVLPWTGNDGYRKAEVTGGGVRLDAVDPRTLESRAVSGLFLCGEILDAFGPIGGHNFSWAWATGRAAGTASAL
jgi:hypothetical protein